MFKIFSGTFEQFTFSFSGFSSSHFNVLLYYHILRASYVIMMECGFTRRGKSREANSLSLTLFDFGTEAATSSTLCGVSKYLTPPPPPWGPGGLSRECIPMRVVKGD